MIFFNLHTHWKILIHFFYFFKSSQTFCISDGEADEITLGEADEIILGEADEITLGEAVEIILRVDDTISGRGGMEVNR